MRRLIAAVGACGLGVAFAAASGAAPPPPAPTPAALAEQLGSEQFAEREAASAALERLGAAAIPALRAAANGSSPEARDRAQALLTRLTRQAESRTRLAARRVALEYRDVPLGSALNDLRTRTGLNVTLDPQRVENPLRKVTCVTGELPVWEALDAFCAAAGVREAFRADIDVPKPSSMRRGFVPPPAAPNADAVPVVLIDGAPEKLAGARGGAVRVLVLPATFPGHKVTLGTGDLTLALDVTPVPGLGWQEVVGVKVHKLIDSEGRAGGAGTEKNPSPTHDPTGTVVFARPGVALRFDANGNSIPPESLPNTRVVAVPLKLGTPAARSLRRLEGSVFAEVQVPNQQLIVVDQPEKRLNTAFEGPGDVRFTVLEVKAAPGPGGLGTVKVQLEHPSDFGLNARRRGFNNFGWPEAPRPGGQGNRVEAFDAAGNPFPMSTSASMSFSNDGLVLTHTYTMTFRPGQGLPARLAVVGPKLVTVEVPFALDDVPLP
ncbi:Uncharacterized protein OS=Isosphaera pallida (strain ATCC 43644 / DSM 9630 / IS1B) GN=Isop_3204 PE=4 SV=1 [Gemmataceae bacterium]|nr:Uncharacterized protein OS=Isosphaera pallida (strain ATCC 43644 / DSM 9630 / IS1B) GN=Isop_3204 PE=4 SV=1 [Gemmataceae bacterium]VTU02225.1 Uncharacterized protein OS=Isosphaera pallida (strain ATCC 43644 / DSM 9630 / IS1B) GN=Isop_3204 PE=4 SV=1 [Gemmataceae bacterium]